MEIGTFCVVPLLFLRGNARRVEASLKYFIINIIAALMVLFGALLFSHKAAYFGASLSSFSGGLKFSKEMGFFYTMIFSKRMILGALIIKLGIFPFHFWFPEVLQGVGFLEGLLISTFQKVPPFYLRLIIKTQVKRAIPVVIGAFSVLAGGWGGLNQTQIRKILGFSSVSFMG